MFLSKIIESSLKSQTKNTELEALDIKEVVSVCGGYTLEVTNNKTNHALQSRSSESDTLDPGYD